MKTTAVAALVIALAIAPALAITLAPAEQAECEAEGGCIVITAKRLETELQAFKVRTLRECRGAS